jgi:uncharacterized coiled-coil DUF342 family protein
MQTEMTKLVAERDSLRKEATRMATKALKGRKTSQAKQHSLALVERDLAQAVQAEDDRAAEVGRMREEVRACTTYSGGGHVTHFG